MSRNLRVGAAVYGGSVIIPIDGKNPSKIPIGSIVGLDAAGNLKIGAPTLGVITAMNGDGTCSVGISGVFNAIGVSGAIGSVDSATNALIMSSPFSGFSVDDEGKKSTVANVVMVKI